MASRAGQLVRFGPFEFDPVAQELRKHGLRQRLQGKPAQLLAALVEAPGRVLARDELQRRLWPGEAFGDFENGLNTSMKRLRAALNDSADEPLYIQTVARAGYRFVAPVESKPGLSALAGAPPAAAAGTRRLRWAAVSLGLAATALAGWFWWRTPAAEPVAFRQLTFQRGPVFNARFAPDGQGVVYAAQWDEGPRQIYLNNGVSPESRPLGLAGSLFAVSRRGELALYEYGGTMPIAGGALLRVPMNGGAPVAVERGVMSADWTADGGQLAIVRAAGGRNTLEYPSGRALYSTAGWISGVRFSPRGDRIAFVDHPARHDDGGRLLVTDRAGRVVELTAQWALLSGVAWRPGAEEVWFSGTRTISPSSLWAVRSNRAGTAARPLGQFPGAIRLRDVAPNGSVLLGRESQRLESAVYARGARSPRDMSWLGWTRAVDAANDGRVLFDESGEAVGGAGTTFLFDPERGTQRLGEGWAQGFSPDGREALVLSPASRRDLRLLPLSGGSARPFRDTKLEYQWARYYPDGRSLLALASYGSADPLRLYRVPASGPDAPTALTEPGMVRHAAIAPDGERVAYLTADGKLKLAPEGRVLHEAQALAPLQWTLDGRRIYVQHLRSGSVLPAQVSLFELATGRLESWREFAPRDPVGVDQLTRILMSPDARVSVFTVRRIQSELFLATGIR